MATLRLTFFADAISKQTSMTVLLPQEAEGSGPYPVLYLLHGLSDDDTIWTRRTSIERYVTGMPLIVVMPDGGRSFYTDARQGPAYESHIMGDVLGLVDRFFPTIAERRGRAIGGLSMGGYGAMKLALKYCDRFCSVVSHSSVFDIAKSLKDSEHREELALIFGDDPAEGDNDVFRLAEKAEREMLPAIRFDCGTEDGLLEHSRAFHRHLEDLGTAHQYEEFPGAHEWGYWDRHIQEALRFHAAALGIV
ncbi:MAG: alpha/beta hydrolase [Planctomycetota bacterium]|jgi:S-formylglutathione hydrolase FrmB